VLLTLGKSAAGLAAAEEGMAFLASGIAMQDGEAYLRLAHAEALAANARHNEAAAAIRTARDRLRERAAKISRPEWRESFLTKVPENARTFALAREWLGEA
jgi:ribosome-associated translation inhibitor RaiA